MKKKEKASMHAMSPTELVKIVTETEAKLRGHKATRYNTKSKNVREGRVMKNKIAIGKTLLRQKELEHEQK